MITDNKRFSLSDRASSFRFAFAGIVSFVRSEHNAWIHLAAAVGAVILGWIMGKDCMTLYFDTFQIATLFVSVLLVNYLIQDGKSRKFPRSYL